MFKMRSRHIVPGTLVVLAALSLGSCARKEDESKTNTPQPTQTEGPASKAGNSSSSTTAPAPPAAPAIATADGETPGVRVEVQELKRGSDNTLTLKFAIVNDSDKDVGFGYDFGDEANHIKDYGSIGGVTLIDGTNKKKYFVVRDTESNCVCSRGLKDIKPRTRANLWAKFPAPPDDVQKIGVVIPHFGPLDDVSISR